MNPLNCRQHLEHQEPHARSGGAAQPAMPSGAAAEASASLPRLAQHVGGHDLRCSYEFGVSSKCKTASQHSHPARLGCEDTTVCEHAPEPVQVPAVSASMIPAPPEHCTPPDPTACVPGGGGGADSPQLPMPGMPRPRHHDALRGHGRGCEALPSPTGLCLRRLRWALSTAGSDTCRLCRTTLTASRPLRVRAMKSRRPGSSEIDRASAALLCGSPLKRQELTTERPCASVANPPRWTVTDCTMRTPWLSVPNSSRCCTT
mmetsp:Transcript_2554/g.5155  ORF Transcript_2554/g.5155 Transcript_2554/m.5155 type:complete len:260 (-) Transcript_2554:596-1375(-)